MNYQSIISTVGDDYVATITLNRPDQLNTFNTSLALELDQALRELDTEPHVGLSLSRGPVKSFAPVSMSVKLQARPRRICVIG